MNFSLPLACAVVILDQATKYAAEKFLSHVSTFPLVAGVFHLTLARNQGAAFSILRGGTLFLVLVSVFCIAALILMLLVPKCCKHVLGFETGDTIVKVSLGLILGGACGNLIDRLRFSYVIDFLDFRIWPVFNFADSAITIGGILICLRMLRKKELKVKDER
jgi:signal peptidase II